MRELDTAIISCAVTGAIHTPTMSPHLPITAEEIASEAVAAAKAGASIVHVHVRDEATGEPVTDLDLFRQVAARDQLRPLPTARKVRPVRVRLGARVSRRHPRPDFSEHLRGSGDHPPRLR
ncbi:MAG: 3-keto-5-aminohexanoate cleavage protein [Haloplanus sp.]